MCLNLPRSQLLPQQQFASLALHLLRFNLINFSFSLIGGKFLHHSQQRTKCSSEAYHITILSIIIMCWQTTRWQMKGKRGSEYSCRLRHVSHREQQKLIRGLNEMCFAVECGRLAISPASKLVHWEKKKRKRYSKNFWTYLEQQEFESSWRSLFATTSFSSDRFFSHLTGYIFIVLLKKET